MAGQFAGKVAIVTGASKGIGLELARLLLNEGALVAGVARSAEVLRALPGREGFDPERFLPLPCDVTASGGFEAAVAEVLARFGRIDLLINNAGRGLTGPALATDQQTTDACFELNFHAPVRCIKAVVPAMLAAGAGTIVNITSIVARRGLPTCAVYSGAKAALAMYSQGLRAELLPAGIDVLTIYPGNTATDFHSDQQHSGGRKPRAFAQRGMAPAQVAAAILASVAARKAETVVGLGGKIMTLIGNVSPRLLDRLLIKLFGIGPGYSTPLAPVAQSPLLCQTQLVSVAKPCRYHALASRVDPDHLLPAGQDPLLQYLLYPYMLAMVYSSGLNSVQRYRHPLTGGPVELRPSPPPRLERIKNCIKTMLIPVLPMGRAKHSVVLAANGAEHGFDLGYEQTICPAAFRSFFPLMATQDKTGAQTDANSWAACCPDHLKHHVFGAPAGRRNACAFGDGARIATTRPCRTGQATPANLGEMARAAGVPCPSLLNTALGYYFTLAAGGELAFYSRSFSAAIFQCPSTQGRVVVEIIRKADAITLHVRQVLGQPCQRGIRPGDAFPLPLQPGKAAVCLHAFNVLYLCAGLAESGGTELAPGCLLEGCGAAWTVTPASGAAT